jgi:hypothetical protein
MTDTPNSQEDRLKGILYCFMELQDRLATDRLDAANQRAETAELIKLFREEIKRLQMLFPQLRREIGTAIEEASTVCTERIGAVIQEAASEKVDRTAAQLQRAVDDATHRLEIYERTQENTFFYWMIAFFIGVMLAAFLVGKMAVPRPYLALTGEELETYQHGQVAEAFWPKLSKEEQSRLIKLARSGDAKEGAGGDQS